MHSLMILREFRFIKLRRILSLLVGRFLCYYLLIFHSLAGFVTVRRINVLMVYHLFLIDCTWSATHLHLTLPLPLSLTSCLSFLFKSLYKSHWLSRFCRATLALTDGASTYGTITPLPLTSYNHLMWLVRAFKSINRTCETLYFTSIHINANAGING